MTPTTCKSVIAALASAVSVAAYAADSPPASSRPADTNGKECFYAPNISSWAPQGYTTVNVKVGVRDYYQIQLLTDCRDIDWNQRIGIEHRGSNWICSGLDATVIVRSPIGPRRCPATSVRKLTPDEVKALPKGAKP